MAKQKTERICVIMLTTNLFNEKLVLPSISPRKTIFVTGAGISADRPTCLPIGVTLTDAYLDMALGIDYANRFRDIWTTRFTEIKESITGNTWHKPVPKVMDNERPRLEFIIGEIDKMDRPFVDPPFADTKRFEKYRRKRSIDVLRNFASAPPNMCHRWMAEYCKSGSLIITANFDSCIESALGCDHDEPTTTYGIRSLGGVLHYHGLAKTNDIAATIKSISRPLPEEFKMKIKELFKAGYNVVFLGYGAVDVFDIKPFFDEIANENYSGIAIYVCHCSTSLEAKRAEKGQSTYGYLLRPFRKSLCVYGRTLEFLDQFAVITGIKRPELIVTDICSDTWIKTKDELNMLLSHPLDRRSFYLTNLMRICDQLSIHPGYIEPNWAKMSSELLEEWGDDAIAHLASASGNLANSVIEGFLSDWNNKEYQETVRKLKEIIHTHYKDKTGPLTPYLKMGTRIPDESIVRHSVQKTYSILKSDREYEEGIEISTIHYLCGERPKEMIQKWIDDSSNRRKTEEYLLFHLSQVSFLLNLHYTRFKYRTFYLSLCRMENRIKALLYDDGWNSETLCFGDLDNEWDICMQIPDLYDAARIIKNRLEQYDFRRIRGLPVNKLKESELLMILNKIEAMKNM